MEIREDRTYRAYLVQCWKEGPTAWRFAAQQIGAETRRRGFGNLEELVAFLRTELKREKEAENMKRETQTLALSKVEGVKRDV